MSSQGAQTQYQDPAGNARQLEGQFFGTKYAAVTLNSASGTTPQLVVTAPADKYMYIRGLQITIDPTCTTAAGGMDTVTLATVTGAQTIAALRMYIPAAFVAPTVPTVNRQTAAPGGFFATTVLGEQITATMTTALTAGTVRVSFNYGFSDVPIGNG